ncbi:MAG TPA: TatD family hydrolase, partial [Gemmatimonadales bacterium]|nr:TatD family hydrolase [Gemmatimonadales bacterium]
MLIDTHCHLASEQFAADLPEVLERTWASPVAHVVVIGETRPAAERALELAAAEPRLSVVAGVHPHDAAGWDAGMEAWLVATLEDPRVVAAGEMGLDYHYDHSPRDAQRQVFERQLELAAQARKPVVIHAREADDDVAAILRNHPDITAILHSFSSGPGLLRAGLDAGHYVSFSGMVTFKNWRDDDAVRLVPGDRLLVETDAPYLAPVPHRGRRNEPAFVRDTALRVAALREVDPELLIAQTGE